MENKIIQSFWVGKITTMERLCIRSFMANGHEFNLYTYGTLEGVPDGCVIKDAAEILPESDIKRFPFIQQFADFFRYTLLYKKGGWWVDMDMVCLKPIDLEQPYVFVPIINCPPAHALNFAVIKVPKESPVVKSCIEESLKRDWQTMEFQSIGPDLWGPKVAEFGLEQYVTPIEMFDPIHWPRIAEITLPDKTWDLTNSYGLHLFHAAWNPGSPRAWGAGAPSTDAKHPDGCLYEQLKRKYLPEWTAPGSPVVYSTPSVVRSGHGKYAKDGLTLNWWDTHKRV